jgi:hypothetical protein
MSFNISSYMPVPWYPVYRKDQRPTQHTIPSFSMMIPQIEAIRTTYADSLFPSARLDAKQDQRNQK